MKITDNLIVLKIERDGSAIYPVFAFEGDAETPCRDGSRAENARAGRRILVDTGFPGQEPLFAEALAGAGFSLGELTEIILTHQDMDHIGCCKSFLAGAPACRALAHEDETPCLTGAKTPVKLAAMEAKRDELPADTRAFLEQMRQGYENRRLEEVVCLTDGETLPFCGGIDVIHTPGHTPGHCCLYFRAAKTLVVGDALNIRDGSLTGPAPQHTLDMELALRSLKKLSAFDAETVVTYHGGVFRGDVREALAALIG